LRLPVAQFLASRGSKSSGLPTDLHAARSIGVHRWFHYLSRRSWVYRVLWGAVTAADIESDPHMTY